MMRLSTATLFLAIGIALAVGGAWLIVEGGSWYYVSAAAAFLASGGLLAARRPLALPVYALLVVGTLGWSLWEVGLDWWQLAPRGAVVVVLGLWLLVPAVTRDMAPATDPAKPRRPTWRGSGLPLTVALIFCIAVAMTAPFTDPHTVDGELPEARADFVSDDGGIPAGDWHAYGRTGFGQRYSPLDQITPENVDQLQEAWNYHTGDLRQPGDPVETTFEVTPLKVDDTLYLCTPHHYVIALDATNGQERWRFDPEIEKLEGLQHRTCRGVAYSQSADPDAAGSCPRRIFLPTADARLIALNADTGEVCPRFGGNGTVDLWKNMPHIQEGFYYSTSPPTVTAGLVIVGGAVNDNVSTTEPSGVIRAYDIDTGDLMWAWDAGNPHRTEPLPPGQTYSENSPNSWSIFSVDETLGMVYVPMGNQPPDQWGGNRDKSVERFASAIVALDIATGRPRWVFQTVHHDLWDMDVPAQPSLLTLDTTAGPVPALVAPTKQGDVFVLDRRNGQPLLPVTEEPVPQGAAEGDYTAPTQPTSALSFKPPPLEGRDMWGVTLFDQLICRIKFHSLRYEGRFTPPSTQGTIVHPGNFGVFNWGGVAVDPVRQVMFATPSYLAFTSTLIPREDETTNYVSEGEPGLNENYGAPFAARLEPFVSPLGLPCQAPPWGYVAGADLRSGRIAWRHPNGTVRDRAPVPLPFKMGVPDLGGPIVTAGGVAFMSGTLDYYVRAYDVTTGEQLWESRLPAGGQATPMTYLDSRGRQVVLVAAGGHGSLGTKVGDSVIAYTLP